MSFILDALRKSERERRQEEAPSISRIPEAVPPRETPTWAIATIVALGIGFVAVAGAWVHAVLNTPSPPGGDATRVGIDAGERAPTTAETRVERVGIPPPTAASTGSSSLAAAASQEPAATAAGSSQPRADARPQSTASSYGAGSSASPSLTSPSSSAASAAQAPRSVGGGLREAATATAQSTPPARGSSASLPAVDPVPASYTSNAPSLGLPELRIELLAYADDPAQRFVFINGRRYQEGDSLSEGPRVIAINSRGVVLLAGGRQLQLDQH